MSLFEAGGKTGVPGEKTFGARIRTNNKLNPHMTRSPGMQPRPLSAGGERLHHCAFTALTSEADHYSDVRKKKYFTIQLFNVRRVDSENMYLRVLGSLSLQTDSPRIVEYSVA